MILNTPLNYNAAGFHPNYMKKGFSISIIIMSAQGVKLLLLAASIPCNALDHMAFTSSDNAFEPGVFSNTLRELSGKLLSLNLRSNKIFC